MCVRKPGCLLILAKRASTSDWTIAISTALRVIRSLMFCMDPFPAIGMIRSSFPLSRTRARSLAIRNPVLSTSPVSIPTVPTVGTEGAFMARGGPKRPGWALSHRGADRRKKDKKAYGKKPDHYSSPSN